VPSPLQEGLCLLSEWDGEDRFWVSAFYDCALVDGEGYSKDEIEELGYVEGEGGLNESLLFGFVGDSAVG
jgi:hypothetical protein